MKTIGILELSAASAVVVGMAAGAVFGLLCAGVNWYQFWTIAALTVGCVGGVAVGLGVCK